MNKYRAKPVTIDNIRFHSTAEGRRYLELKTMERAGLIEGLELQPRFPLHAYKDGKLLGEYRADFAYWSNNGPFTNSAWPIMRVVEDVKGIITPLSKWKIRHAEAEYNFKVQIVRMGRHGSRVAVGTKRNRTSDRIGRARARNARNRANFAPESV